MGATTSLDIIFEVGVDDMNSPVEGSSNPAATAKSEESRSRL